MCVIDFPQKVKFPVCQCKVFFVLILVSDNMSGCCCLHYTVKSRYILWESTVTVFTTEYKTVKIYTMAMYGNGWF